MADLKFNPSRTSTRAPRRASAGPQWPRHKPARLRVLPVMRLQTPDATGPAFDAKQALRGLSFLSVLALTGWLDWHLVSGVYGMISGN